MRGLIYLSARSSRRRSTGARARVQQVRLADPLWHDGVVAECFYCGMNASLTRAHLFQQTFRDAISASSGEVALASSSSQALGMSSDIVYPGDARQSNVTSLCARCNNGWMNDIEVAAGPAFQAIMRGAGFPRPEALFKLAHWAIVVGALSSELFPRLEIPVEHRRQIRNTTTGQPTDFSTHFVWTHDHLPNLEISLLRAETKSPNPAVGWCFMLQAGPLVIYSASPLLGPRVSRVLHDNRVEGVLGAISSNVAYVPWRKREKPEELHVPTHALARSLHGEMVGATDFVETRGKRRLVDFGSGLVHKELSFAFDYGDRLMDMRDQLDLSYLADSFQ